jgi:hypothetical protein
VLVLHGTTMSGTAMLAANFAGELFGPGQALDASKYIVLPDSIGHGKSAKPFDWLRAKFPDDMVSAQYRLVTEGLSVRHLRMVLDNDSGVRGNARPPYHVVCEILEAASARSIADSAAKRLLAVPKVSDRTRAVYRRRRSIGTEAVGDKLPLAPMQCHGRRGPRAESAKSLDQLRLTTRFAVSCGPVRLPAASGSYGLTDHLWMRAVAQVAVRRDIMLTPMGMPTASSTHLI